MSDYRFISEMSGKRVEIQDILRFKDEQLINQIQNFLKKNNCNGLMNTENNCRCDIDNLMPCDGFRIECKACRNDDVCKVQEISITVNGVKNEQDKSKAEI